VRRPRSGVLLVEWLLALALAGLVLIIAIDASRSTAVAVASLAARVELVQRELAVPQLLSTLLAEAGRGLVGCQVTILDAGRRLRWQTQRGLADPVLTLEVFADVDSAKRPALYQRQLPSARQPWLEGVIAFKVTEVSLSGGVWVPAPGPPGERIDRVRLEVGWEDGSSSQMVVALPHTPCLGFAE